jgi:hypothetical protein
MANIPLSKELEWLEQYMPDFVSEVLYVNSGTAVSTGDGQDHKTIMSMTNDY